MQDDVEVTKLLGRAQQGDPVAQTEVIRLLQARAVASLDRGQGRRLGLESGMLASDAFLKSFKDPNCAFPDHEQFFCWATRIMFEQIEDERRKSRAIKRGGHATVLHDSRVLAEIPAKEGLSDSVELKDVIDQLEKENPLWAALARGLEAGMTWEEMALWLGRPPTTIFREWHHGARMRLRELLGGEDGDET